MVEIFGYPPFSEMPTQQADIDMHFVIVGVDRAAAKFALPSLPSLPSLSALLKKLEPEGWKIEDGPSYIHWGAALGSQDDALRLMAAGKYLGLWRITSAADFGPIMEWTPEEIDAQIGQGMMMTVGWYPEGSEKVPEGTS